MATLSPSELLDWLGKHQFLTSAQTDDLRPALWAFYPDSHSLAKELIRRDWLTAYQVNQILQGKHDQLILGSYRLTERIGEGAMGQVFKAWSTRLGRIVALKTIQKERVNHPATMERFRREMEAAAKLDHPNICRVRDADEANGRSFLVMDFIEGRNLSTRVKQEGPLSIPEAAEIIRQAALGLQHAFERGVVHRDIKPANFVVTPSRGDSGAAPLVKVLDFGLARFESEADEGGRLTKIGHLLGTVDYVAPEQAQNARSADIRADIYSLGCTFYYLLTAQPPFGGENVLEKIGPRLTGEAPWVRSLRPDTPPALEEILRTMMARRPEDRFQTPIEVAHALEPFAGVIPPPAPGVVMALPVAADAIVAGDVPLAEPIPVATVPSEAAGPQDPSFFEMTATGLDLSSNTKPVASAESRKPKRTPVVMVAALASVGLVLVTGLCLVACLLSFVGGDPMKPGKGAIEITDAKFSMPDGTIHAGDRKFVLVWFKRSGFKGPVTLSLENLPEGVRSHEKVLQEKETRTDLAFTVSHGTDPLVKEIKVVIESKAAGVRAEAPLQLRIIAAKN